MKVLIIENESLSAGQLKEMITEVNPGAEFLPVVPGVKESILVLSSVIPDVIFMDIELSDGTAFDIFDEVSVQSPVVFTTAYNQYITRAFDNNGVAYLLKPIRPEMVKKAFDNLERNRQIFLSQPGVRPYSGLKGILAAEPFKSRFLVKQGQKMIPVKTEDINHFASDGSIVFLVTTDKRKYVVDKTLSELETILHPADFFRVNRKYLVARDAILSLDYHTKGQVAVNARLLEGEKLVVSRQQTPVFKTWLGQ